LKSRTLSLAAPNPDAELIASVERLLEAVKTGEVVGLAWVAVQPGNGTMQHWGGEATLTMLVGAAHELATSLTMASLSNLEKTE